jgi:hypothetical protein
MFAVLPCAGAALGLRSRDRWKNLGFAVLAFSVVTMPWFLSYAPRVLRYVVPSDAAMTTSQALNRRTPGHTDPLEQWLLYPLSIKDALGWPGVVTVLLGAALAPVAGALPLLGAVGGIAALSPLAQAQDRYVLPALALLAPLVSRLGRRWWGALVVLGVFGPQLHATVDLFRPGAAKSLDTMFDHPVSTAGVLSWPRSRSYAPTDFDLRSWKIDDAIRAIRAAHGRADGTIGLLLPRAANVPEFGTFLARSATFGNHWDFANVNLAAGKGGLPDEFFLGPMRDGDWPPATFTVLYAILLDPPDPDATSWLTRRPLVESQRFALPNRAVGILYLNPGATAPAGAAAAPALPGPTPPAPGSP